METKEQKTAIPAAANEAPAAEVTKTKKVPSREAPKEVCGNCVFIFGKNGCGYKGEVSPSDAACVEHFEKRNG